MAKQLDTKTIELLTALFNGTKSASRLTPFQAVSLAEQGLVSVSSGNLKTTSKARRAMARHENSLTQNRVNQALSYFLGTHMRPGVGYSVKPQGKSNATSILPHVSELGIDRDQVLSALKALRDIGIVETNASDVKNNCSIRWFLSGTYELDNGVPQNTEPKAEGMQLFTING